jgi:alpha/beta superfamily hydrolase
MPSRLQSISDLRGPAGRLEAILNSGKHDAPYSVLLCHPHPPSGGTMHNKVVYHAMKTFSSLGLPVLRFNFRGAGLSEGLYDHGIGERDDVLAAIDWLNVNLHLPILFAGFSFGAAIGLHACHADPRVRALIALGLPIHTAHRDYTYLDLLDNLLPKLFILGDQDQFAPRKSVESTVAALSEPKRLVWISDADHFFAGTPDSPASKIPAMQAALHGWLIESFPLLKP